MPDKASAFRLRGGEAIAPSASGVRQKQVRRLAGQLGAARVALTTLVLLLALLLARFSGHMPLFVDAEQALYDVRAVFSAPYEEQDQRITLITYTDEVLIERKIRSPLDRALLADALKILDTMGAASIGIDILFDQETDADPQLQAQLRAMRTPTFVAYAAPDSNPNNIQLQQTQFLSRFIDGVETATTRPASIRLETDEDDTLRRWPGHAPGTPPLFTVAMADKGDFFSNYTGAIRWRLPAQMSTGPKGDGGVDTAEIFENIPITTFTDPAIMTPETMPFFAEQLRGRHILIGGDIIDVDEFTTPMTRLADPASGEFIKMIGLEAHAHMLAQILDDAPFRQLPGWSLWLAALLAIAAGAATALLDLRPWQSAVLMVGQLAVILLVPVVMQSNGIDTLPLPVAGASIGWLLAFIATTSAVRAVGAEERAFAQGALGKYLPRDIAQEILRDPERLALHGEKKAIYCLFSDLEGFTKMSHALSPENVAYVLNAYLDTLSEVVLAHGGTIDKFVGDAVVAFWGAPIARPDDADQASRALLAMAEAGEAFRKRMAENPELEPIGRTRVGLHHGEAVVGNFGGEGRIQYTALGDSMNTAARLEAANKAMKTRALASTEALEGVERGVFVPMGRIQLRGRSQPVDVFEPRPDLDKGQRAAIATLVATHAAGKGSDYQAQRDAVLAMDLPARESVDFLVERLDWTKPGEFYALG